MTKIKNDLVYKLDRFLNNPDFQRLSKIKNHMETLNKFGFIYHRSEGLLDYVDDSELLNVTSNSKILVNLPHEYTGIRTSNSLTYGEHIDLKEFQITYFETSQNKELEFESQLLMGNIKLVNVNSEELEFKLDGWLHLGLSKSNKLIDILEIDSKSIYNILFPTIELYLQEIQEINENREILLNLPKTPPTRILVDEMPYTN